LCSFIWCPRSHGVGISLAFICVSVSVYLHDIYKMGSPNLTNKCFTMSPGNFYFGVKGQGHESQKHCRHGSTLLWVLAYSSFFSSCWYKFLYEIKYF